MGGLILKQDIVESIKNDAILYGYVASALNIKAVSLRKILADNDPKLTQASVIRILRKKLGKNDSQLLEEETNIIHG